MTLRRPCARCGTPVRGECPCKPKKRQQKPRAPHARSTTERGYGADYQALAAQVVAHAREHNLPCYKCGRSLEGRKITVDHIVPLRAGGRNVIENLAPCCTRCNYGWRRRTGKS